MDILDFELLSHFEFAVIIHMLKVEYGVDEIAYQIGETTEILSSGRLCATPHCVRAPRGDAASSVDRTTFALFMQPDWYGSFF
ncbi:hypothetical protein HAX54_047066 [Datura stramonium]|uniref:Isopenicillin N synthase-like Fe(2+) 2OG dioxygenase domain-containing protein n=1 Tax=Datura stramonium TaxID=4076 RepID=A0ABS8SS35_DATST|nr:hypothetical protein [Datura stramonium]